LAASGFRDYRGEPRSADVANVSSLAPSLNIPHVHRFIVTDIRLFDQTFVYGDTALVVEIRTRDDGPMRLGFEQLP
jgi:hypothetical protein